MAERTSFQDAEQSGKSLRELIEQQGLGEAEDQDKVLDEPTDTLVEEEPLQEAGGAEGATGKEVSAPAFASYLRDQGYDVDDSLEEKDLYAAVVERLRSQESVAKQIETERQERQRLAAELEELRKIREKSSEPASVEPQQAPQKPQPEQKADELWGPLPDFDQDSLRLVEQDPDTGMFVSRSEYRGLGGEQAANQINEYHRKLRARSQALVKDPSETIWRQGLESKINKLVEDRMAEITKRLETVGDVNSQASRVYDTRVAEQQRQARIDSFWSERAGDLIKLHPDGQPMRSLNGDVIPTDVGRAFYAEMDFLRSELGVADEEKLIQTAWRNVSRGMPQQEAPQAPAPAAEPKPASGQEKRKKFVERRSAEIPEVPADRDGYEGAGRRRRTAPPTLLELAKDDPEVRRLLE